MANGTPPPPRGQPPPGGNYGPPPGGYYAPPPQWQYQRVFNGEFESYNRYPRDSNDNVLGGLCYLSWIVSLVVLVGVKPHSPYLHFHAVQALALQIVIMIGAVILAFTVVCSVLSIVLWAYMIVVLVMVLTGKDHRVPYLADWVEERYV